MNEHTLSQLTIVGTLLTGVIGTELLAYHMIYRTGQWLGTMYTTPRPCNLPPHHQRLPYYDDLQRSSRTSRILW